MGHMNGFTFGTAQVGEMVARKVNKKKVLKILTDR
jgi:hypothetical protein